MKTITIKKLTLQDWRAQNKVVEFTDNTEIRGYNKSGKSSVYNAFLWLLTGCDDMDRSNYNLFDNTIEQTHDTSKVASVEGVFEIDGVEYTLKRTAEIGWTRKKGRDEWERKGSDNYKFYLDHIERNAGDYKKTIEDLFAPIDKLKIMLNLQYFLRLDWKEMRKHLQDMVGEISMDDFKGDYSDILNDLRKYSPEEVKVSYKARIKPLKENVGQHGDDGKLGIEISTLQSNLPKIEDLDEVQQEIDDAKSQIEMIDKQILGSSEGVQKFIDKRNEELAKIGELESEYNKCKNLYIGKHNDELSRVREEITKIAFINAEISRENDKNKKTISNSKESLKLATSKLKKLNEYREQLLKQNEEVKAVQFTDDTCAFCGQKLPEDKLEEAKAKFNANKEAKHKSIVAEGKANNLKIEQCKKEIAELEAIIEKGYEEKPLKDKSEFEAKLRNLELEFVPYEQTTEGKEKLAVISNMKVNLTVIPAQKKSALPNMKKSLMQDIETLSKKLGLKDEYDKQMAVIQSKQKELKDSAVELARLEGMLSKVNAYEREKASIISDRVNGKFDYIQVEMTEVNKSGELVDTCKILDADGVSASSTNFASQVRCGIDISTAFCNFYGINLPMFIDFAESICEDNYPDTERQTIKLIVDECKFNVFNK